MDAEDVVAALRRVGAFTSLLQLLEKPEALNDLEYVVEASSWDGVTLLAPTDEAFEALLPSARKFLDNPDNFHTVFSLHILRGAHTFNDLKGHPQGNTYRTWGGFPLEKFQNSFWGSESGDGQGLPTIQLAPEGEIYQNRVATVDPRYSDMLVVDGLALHGVNCLLLLPETTWSDRARQ